MKPWILGLLLCGFLVGCKADLPPAAPPPPAVHYYYKITFGGGSAFVLESTLSLAKMQEIAETCDASAVVQVCDEAGNVEQTS